MSNLEKADLKTGGRLSLVSDHILASRLRSAAGVLRELADDLNVQAENADGLLAPDDQPADDWSVTKPASPVKQATPQELQSCARGAHAYPQEADANGWRTCTVCGHVYVSA